MNDMNRRQTVVGRRERLHVHGAEPSTINYQLSTTNSSRGFTLIETFIAITILITAVAGPLTIASKGLQSAVLAKDQLTASFLAQEGIEYVREKRDNNCLELGCTDLETGDPIPGQWLTGLDACRSDLNGGQMCQIDAVNDIITTCASGGCSPLYYDNSANGGFYTYNTAHSRTTFVRSVQITPISDHEATVSATVSWKTGPFARQIVVSEIILDWQ